jgi:hypothetical protein
VSLGHYDMLNSLLVTSISLFDLLAGNEEIKLYDIDHSGKMNPLATSNLKNGVPSALNNGIDTDETSDEDDDDEEETDEVS